MDQQEIDYCKSCSIALISEWKGWPHKDVIPLLPKLGDGQCGICDETIALDNGKINWYNYHSQHNTGLPDYWLLVVSDEKAKWGSPYLGEVACKRCNSSSVISEMNFPNGSSELKLNCPNCGVIRFQVSKMP